MTQGSQSTLCVMSPDSHNLDESLKEPFTAITSEITQSVYVRERSSFLSHTKVLSSCLTGLKNLCESVFVVSGLILVPGHLSCCLTLKL